MEAKQLSYMEDLPVSIPLEVEMIRILYILWLLEVSKLNSLIWYLKRLMCPPLRFAIKIFQGGVYFIQYSKTL